jgi:CubicO group peptidase (beta-lactamase class C family)
MEPKHQENWDQLLEFASQLMEKKGVPGAVVGVLHAGELRTAGLGVTNADHPLPVTDETLFQVGSITKTFTTTALMRLVERSQVELDATVRTYLPHFRVADEAASSGATVRHLVTHMSGWYGDFFHDAGPDDEALARYVAAMADLEQVAPLGSVWSYNNSGFSVAGRIIEVVTGQTYEAALKELVLEPLGLEHTFLDPGDVMTFRFAVGHDAGDEGAKVLRPWALPRALRPAGGITCRVTDLLSYGRFHLGDGTTKNGSRLLTPESMSRMQTPQATIWKDETIGLGWALNIVDGARRVGHGGGTKGQVSLLTLLPEHSLAVAVLTNANQGGSVTDGITDWVLAHYLGLDIPRPEPIETSEEELAAYVGLYQNPHWDLELGMLCGRLIGQVVTKRGFPSEDVPPPPPPPPATLTLCEKDRLLVLDGPAKSDTADAVRLADGSIGWLRFGGRLGRRQK